MDTLHLHGGEMVYVDRDAVLAPELERRVRRRVQEDAKVRAYPARQCVFDTVCGHFTSKFSQQYHDGVCLHGNIYFGRHVELYHIDGLLYCYRDTIHFKGCRDTAAMDRIARDLCLCGNGALVHMTIVSGCLGKRVRTDLGCYMENQVNARLDSVGVVGRMYDDNITVRLQVYDFAHPEVFSDWGDLPCPSKGDVTVVGSGSVTMRFSWKRVAWSHALEERTRAYCEALLVKLRECC